MIKYKTLKQAQIAVGITMFIFAFFSTAYIQLTSSILTYIIDAEGYTDPVLANMIVTISSLAIIPACLLGAVLGKRMNKHLWSTVSIGCFLVGSGSILLFSQNIVMVLLCRFVVGFGSGILTLIYTAILPDFFEGKSLSTMLGLTTSGGGFWGFVFSGLEVNLCVAYGWKSAYLLHLFAIVPLILLWVLVPTKPLIKQQLSQDGSTEGKSALAPMIFVYSLFGAFIYMGVQVMWSNISLWIRDDIGGTAAQIGLGAGVISIFSCLARLVFGQVYSRMGKKILPLCAALLAAGLLIGAQAKSMALAFVAISLVGAAMGFVAPACLNLCIQAAPERQVTAQAITTIGFNLGNFISSYWNAFINGRAGGGLAVTYRFTSYMSAAVMVLILVLLTARERKKSVQYNKE